MLVLVRSPLTQREFRIDDCPPESTVAELKAAIRAASPASLPDCFFLATLHGTPIHDDAATLAMLQRGSGNGTRLELLVLADQASVELVARYGTMDPDTSRDAARKKMLRKSYISSPSKQAAADPILGPADPAVAPATAPSAAAEGDVLPEECITCEALTVTTCASCAKPVCDKCGFDHSGGPNMSPPSASLPPLPALRTPSKPSAQAAAVRANPHDDDHVPLIDAAPRPAPPKTEHDPLVPAHPANPTRPSTSKPGPIHVSTATATAAAAGRSADLELGAPLKQDQYAQPRPSSNQHPDFWVLVCPECRSRRAQRERDQQREWWTKIIGGVLSVVGLIGGVTLALWPE
ncbi:hypothetical protein HK105_208967 [Polyrhizophydium stewartii]|uniref:Ubiquitin-like domain-containing protein n=1 Tax=Polyrhizophydium stewartii TaxID=2732419 RepID=A0ABR4MWE5_9FUNG|nr:hypothetical protein HK105_000127 [Polyrhizophydium stewartii]